MAKKLPEKAPLPPSSQLVVRPSQLLNVIPPVRQQFAESPVLFVDGIQGFALTDANLVRINWVQDRIGSPMSDGTMPDHIAERHVVLRMIMTLDQFRLVHKWMEAVVLDIDKQIQPAVETK